MLRRALVASMALVLALAAAGAIGWSQRAAIAEWWLAQRVAAMGLGAAQLRVASLGLRGIAIDSIALGAAQTPDLAVEHVEADWTVDSLRAGRFVALRVRGVALRGRFDDAGLSLGALDPLWKQSAAATSAPVLPAPEIALDDAKLRIETSRGAATGTVGGALHEKGGGIDGAFSLDLAGAGLTARGRLSIGGSLAAPSFRVRLDPLQAGTFALRLDVRGRAAPDGVVTLERGSLRAPFGALRFDRVTLDPRARRTTIPLRAEDVDLAALLALATVEGLSGTGHLAGELPLVRAGDAIRIEGGILRATGPGTLVYAPSASVRELAVSRPADLGIAIQAFSDFRYELLEATVTGDVAGALAIGLHVRGVNPGFENGRLIELTLNLESHLADLVRAGTAAYRVPERVEQRIREKAEGR